MKILVADDSPISRYLLTAILRAWGHNVLQAHNGEDAWNILQRVDAPRLVILDWIMPGLDGIQVCNLVRAQEGLDAERPRTHVLMVSSKSEQRDVKKALLAGADGYVAKPFDLATLHQRLRLAMSSLNPHSGSVAREAELRRIGGIEEPGVRGHLPA